MLPWHERPFEIASLLNPAFCALLLCDSVDNYNQEEITRRGMPYALSFLVLPLVLHKSTREALPKSTLATMSEWLEQTPQVLVGFAARTRLLIPFTKEAIVFGMQKKAIQIDKYGKLIPDKHRALHNIALWPNDSEPAMCRKKAGLVGRWFTRSGDAATIFRTWGIRL